MSGLTTSTPSLQQQKKKALEEVDVNLSHQFDQLHHASTDNHPQGSSHVVTSLDLIKVQTPEVTAPDTKNQGQHSTGDGSKWKW
jgi:hypothetical protein